MAELDEMLLSCTVLFSSPGISENVEKHFRNIQAMPTAIGDLHDIDSSIVAEDFEVQTKLWFVLISFINPIWQSVEYYT